jgi:voltage-gated potassium channel
MTNGLALYACLYTFFISANFAHVPDWAVMTGLPLPVIGFVAGTWVHRVEISASVQDREALGHRQLAPMFRWLSPIALIGIATFFTNTVALSPVQAASIMLTGMTAIAAIAAGLSRHIALFVIDTGIIFEGFWRGLTHILAPVFASLTFYLFNTILFASIYRLMDRFSTTPHFMVEGEPSALSFAECIYFSVITLSTVGYGDITPASDSARLVVTLQVIIGAVLILIGVSELLNYSRNRPDPRK